MRIYHSMVPESDTLLSQAGEVFYVHDDMVCVSVSIEPTDTEAEDGSVSDPTRPNWIELTLVSLAQAGQQGVGVPVYSISFSTIESGKTASEHLTSFLMQFSSYAVLLNWMDKLLRDIISINDTRGGVAYSKYHVRGEYIYNPFGPYSMINGSLVYHPLVEKARKLLMLELLPPETAESIATYIESVNFQFERGNTRRMQAELDELLQRMRGVFRAGTEAVKE